MIIGVGAVIAMMEIGQGSTSALQKTIASMGANTLWVQAGAAASGGVTFGSGSAITLTPARLRRDRQTVPFRGRSRAHCSNSRAQIVFGNRNWVPQQISGTTPAFLTVRDWEDFDEGQMFSDSDVIKGSQVCVIGQTIKRELFQDESPIGKEIRIKNVTFKIIGVLSRKGANMMGSDQDDIVLAPWTAVKYRISGAQMAAVNQSAAAAATTGGTGNTINSLSNLYPGTTALYIAPTASQLANTPQPVRFTNVNQIYVKATTTEEIPQAIDQITDLLRDRHRIQYDEPDDFNIRDLTEITKTLSSTSKLMAALLLVVATDFIGRRRRGHYEYHVGFRDRANARDRLANGRRRALLSYFTTIFGRGRRSMSAGRGDRHPIRPRSFAFSQCNFALAHPNIPACHHCCRRRLRHCWNRVWFLSGMESIQIRSHRSPAVRVTASLHVHVFQSYSIMELIRLEDIYKTYHLGEVDVPVLKGISLSIARGEMVALMGASGSGKTTLMNILGCLDHPSSGKFWLDGQEMSGLTPNQRALVRTTKIGFVFQSFNLLPRTSALQNVIMPLDYNPERPVTAEAKRLAKILLDRVGLADRTDHEPSQMSGGQQQRVAIARSLVNQPPLLLADEPTGNLDSHTSVEILQMFQQLNAEGITVILVTHDPKVAAYAHRTILISDGLVENDGLNHSGNGDGRPITSGASTSRQLIDMTTPHTHIPAKSPRKSITATPP